MSDNVKLNETALAWAEIVIRNWEEKIHKLKVTDTYQLLNSFMHHIQLNSNGDPTLIEFAFNFYGRFADMGVGGGISISEVGNSRRKARPWYSKTFFNEVQKLGEILGEKYGRKAILAITEGIEQPSI